MFDKSHYNIYIYIYIYECCHVCDIVKHTPYRLLHRDVHAMRSALIVQAFTISRVNNCSHCRVVHDNMI